MPPKKAPAPVATSPILSAIQDAQDILCGDIAHLKTEVVNLKRILSDEEAKKLKLATETLVLIHNFGQKARKEETADLSDEELRELLASDPKVRELLGEK